MNSAINTLQRLISNKIQPINQPTLNINMLSRLGLENTPTILYNCGEYL